MAEAFHPSVLREGVGDLRSAFASCGRELMRLIELELSQELLATTLRLEKTGQILVHKTIQQCVEHMNHQLQGLDCTIPESRNWAVPELNEISLQESIHWKDYWNSFKNPKLFLKELGERIYKPNWSRYYASESGKLWISNENECLLFTLR